MWKLQFVYIIMMLQLEIWLKYINEYTNFSRPILLSLIFPVCVDVMPHIIPVPGTWLGWCINRATVQVCTCMQVWKPKPGAERSDVEGVLSQHWGSEFLEPCIVPRGCELNSEGPARHQLLTCTVFHTAVDQVAVAGILFLAGPVTLEAVFSCPAALFAICASDSVLVAQNDEGSESACWDIAPLQLISSLRCYLNHSASFPLNTELNPHDMWVTG